MTKILQHPNINPNIKSKPKPKLRSGLQHVFRPPVSFHPKDMVKELDLLDELDKDNRDKYIGDKKISLYNFPTSIMTCIQRAEVYLIRNRIKVGIQTIISCLISNSLDILEEIDDVKDTQEMYNTLYDMDVNEEEDLALDEILIFFGHFPLIPPSISSSDTGKKKQEIEISQEVSARLSRMAKTLGTSSSALVPMLCLISIASLEYAAPNKMKVIDRHIKGFYRRIATRNRMFKAMISTLSEQL